MFFIRRDVQIRWWPILGLWALLLFTCNKEAEKEGEIDLPPIPALPTVPYGIMDGQILEDGQSITLKGVNALQTFGLGDPNLMDEWNIEIVREFIGNLREQPIDGFAIQASDDVWYHPLQNIVDQNRAHQKITILCPFGWVDENGEQQLFTGLNPSEQTFYQAYKAKMQAIAAQFKDQKDVWIEVWNEPFHWNNERGYSHDLWLADMEDMIDNLRQVEGFENIILVPGNEQGQATDAIVEKGEDLMDGRYNLLFDIHAYEKWLNNTTEELIIERLRSLQNAKFPFLFGEIGVENVGGLMEVDHFLNAADVTNISVLAWLWNQNSQDPNALLTDDGLPNDDINNGWGTRYNTFLND